jgi:hypothetical protein
MLFEVVFKKRLAEPELCLFNDFLSEQPKIESESALRALAFHHQNGDRTKQIRE